MKQITTIRHQKLLKLNENLDLLLLGQKNKEYIAELRRMKRNTVEELKKEQRKIGLIK